MDYYQKYLDAEKYIKARTGTLSEEVAVNNDNNFKQWLTERPIALEEINKMLNELENPIDTVNIYKED